MRTATSADLAAVLELLEANKLPLAGVKDHLEHYWLEFANENLIACAGLELHNQAGLLRSVAVSENHRSHQLGTRLVQAVLEYAKANHLSSISLLTQTAQDYFPRFGFQISTRDMLPASLHASAEFRGACPDAAIAMTLKFEH